MSSSCPPFRDALSAQADGEAIGMSDVMLARHLASCAGCRVYASSLDDLRRATRLEAVPVVPDQTAAILAAIGSEPEPAVRPWRIALVIVGLVQLGAALPSLFPDAVGAEAHASIHLAAFGLALSGSFLFVAWKPDYAAAAAPVLILLSLLLVILSAVDVALGRVPVSDEIRHVIALVGAVVVWTIGRTTGRPAPRTRRPLPS